MNFLTDIRMSDTREDGEVSDLECPVTQQALVCCILPIYIKIIAISAYIPWVDMATSQPEPLTPR